MTTKTLPTYTNALSYYRKSGGMRAYYSPAEVLAYMDANPGDVILVLGAHAGTAGRESVSEDDLRRWVNEDEDAAQWSDVAAGESFQ